MANICIGSALRKDQQEEAKRRFIHRFTGDHKPSWAQHPMPNGSEYPLQFMSDGDWLANTFFWVRKDGTLAARRYCEARPTWPLNPELRRA